ncbi:MAG: hypothetical protein V4580_17525 [Bacteroidota bacterium]
MEISTKEIIEGSPAIKAGTIAYSDNFILTVGGVLNIYNDLTDSDCKSIQSTNKLSQIQFAKSFKVADRTFGLINNHLLTSDKSPTLSFTLNGYDAVDDLTCLSQLSNVKSLTVDMFKNNQIDKINQYTSLTKLGLGGGISIKSVTEQKKLEELFLFEKLKDIESIGSMTNLKKITFSKMTIKNLDFLTSLINLKELHFMLGSATNYDKLPDIGKIEKLSFTWVRQLTVQHLLPINEMKFLKELKFDTQAHLTDLDWLTNRTIKTEVINCKTFRR